MLRNIPKVEGHYCRRNSQKQHLHQDFECKAEVFKEYCAFCEEKTIDYFKRTKFYHLLKKYNIAIFKQKKTFVMFAFSTSANKLHKVFLIHILRRNRMQEQLKLMPNRNHWMVLHIAYKWICKL
jgi:hypothetical protein